MRTKLFKIAQAATLGFALIFTVSSCDAANNPSALVGRWVGVSGEEKDDVMELLSDGTGILTKKGSMGGFAITWKTEKGRIYMTASGSAGACGYKLQGSLLTFTEDNGKINEYTKCHKDCKEAAKEYAEAEKAKAEAEKAKAEAEKAKAEAAFKAKFSGVKKSYFTDSRDGKTYTYRTVKLGNQTWMAENLNYETEGSKCDGFCPYGRHYNWSTAMKACPSGWYLPSNTEWDKLLRFVDGDKGTKSPYESETAGKYLKATSGWENEGNGEYALGFSALPGGSDGDGKFSEAGIWWTASEENSNAAYTRKMMFSSQKVHYDTRLKQYLYSVRCLQNETAAAADEARIAKVKAVAEAAAKANRDKVKRGSFTDSRDGNIYKTVKLGEQTWMAENLNYNASGSECYETSESNCQNYGRLYDWLTAKKACPSAWHLPSNAEWDTLYRFADGTSGTDSPYMSETAGKYLKATNDWNENGNGVDAFGFSALPGGRSFFVNSFFGGVGNFGIWWTASENGSDNAYGRGMDYDLDFAFYNNSFKSTFYSVRCLQD
jgi:uncharacterized protein (TIGR02145 family)